MPKRTITAGRKTPDKRAYNAIDPEIALAEMRAADLEPKVPYPGASRPWPSTCLRCSSTVMPRLSKLRAEHKRSCRTCQYRKLGEERRKNGEIARAEMLAVDLEPLEEYPGALKRWRCRCLRCGSDVNALLNTVQQGQGRCCLECRRRARSHDADKVRAEFLSHDLELLEEYRMDSTERLRCLCLRCGSEAETSYRALFAEGTRRCRGCGFMGSGLGDENPAVVYLLHHAEFEALKIGICRQGSRRIRNHTVHGWRVLEEVPVPTVREARSVERRVKTEWRAAGAESAVSGDAMPYGGHTETARTSVISIKKGRATLRRALSES